MRIPSAHQPITLNQIRMIRLGSAPEATGAPSQVEADFLSRLFNGHSGFDVLRWVYLYRPTTIIKNEVTHFPMGKLQTFKGLYGNEADGDRFNAMLEEFQDQKLMTHDEHTLSLTPRGHEIAARLSARRDVFKPLNEQLKTAHHDLAQNELKPLQQQVAAEKNEAEIDRDFHGFVTDVAEERVASLREHLRADQWKMSKDEVQEFRDAIRGYASQISEARRKIAQAARSSAQAMKAHQQELITCREKARQTLTNITLQIVQALS